MAARKKRESAIKFLPPEPPPFRACPKCGLPIQAGENQDRLAFHDCDWVRTGRAGHPVSIESIREQGLQRLRDALPSAAPKDVIAILAQLEELSPTRPKSEPEDEPDNVRSFLAAGSPRP